MSTSYTSFATFKASSIEDNEFKPKLFNNTRLKSKENLFKPKFNRELKKKLKKYKLRRDGKEDPEVVDVSQILISALKIKSPTNRIVSNDIIDSEEELKPKNYLFKMGGKKQITRKKKGGLSDNGTVLTDVIDGKKDNFDSVMPMDKKVDVSKMVHEHEAIESFKANLNENIKDGKCTNTTKDIKETNAFTLMMDSRNKSIGSNSPGKDKVVDELDQQTTIERKNIKAKRNLVLQKMAEAKGSLKKKEMEEYQEKCINYKMEMRAKRLKNMIKANESKSLCEEEKMNSPKKGTISTPVKKDNKDLLILPHKSELKLANILDKPVKSESNSNKKKDNVTIEDFEFLKKLSPSLKKKENMLCYFKKVEKDPDDTFNTQDVDQNTVIKVKVKSKGKKRTKKKKLSLNKITLKEESECVIDNENNTSDNEVNIIEVLNEKKKDICLRYDDKVTFKSACQVEATEFDIKRPKRNVKRPAKYIEEVQLSSSDEDLHIFTPKKKKHADQQNTHILKDKVSILERKPKYTSNLEIVKNIPPQKVNTKISEEVDQPKKPIKLAPIFAVKPQIDVAAIEAKQKFLNSGVPDKLRKMIGKQNKSIGENFFHTVVHVHQNVVMNTNASFKFPDSFRRNDSDDEFAEMACKVDFYKKLLLFKQNLKDIDPNLTIARNKTQVLLQNIKQLYPRFPVYRTYRLLREKNRGEFRDCSYLDLDNSIEVINGLVELNVESPDKLSWTDKYKPTSGKQIIGNFESIKELRKWLISWTENDLKFKKNDKAGSDSSDFYISDADSKDSMKCTNNLLVLTGPVGSGKTSLVYAIAAELAIKVLEVNASSKRTGKIMLQDLQEATQSHKVNRGRSCQENSQNSQEINHNVKLKVDKKRGRPRKQTEVTLKKSKNKLENEVQSQPQTGSQDSIRTGMSLILIDDADIVFEQDDGFCSAIVQLVQCSKRPVILITSTTSCLHLQRFLQYAKIIQTRPLLPRMLGTWLDIMCLAESGTCSLGLGAKCLDYFNGDIRKTINFLQFNTARDSISENENCSQNAEDYKVSIEDENSNMSWSDREGFEEKLDNTGTDVTINNTLFQYYMSEQVNLLCFKYPLNMCEVWWNIPRLLIRPINSNPQDNIKKNPVVRTTERKKKYIDVISNVADMFSIADSYSHISNNYQSEFIIPPWINFESDSVSEQENFDRYDRNSEIIHEISHCLITSSIIKAQNDFGLEIRTDLQAPGMAVKR